ncbi:FUSC family protein [Telmatospirillum sp.]|uniref:FUSC family protein n=1 Tax=Telmatospirillum sp. TaxID=2079197 RepID=UPI00283F4743|nr:FUSC family membrane protein [Telmatospirillum sp.]MDR3436062.1 FUSC family membrane protein [Telmatospirillum sp.]
MPFSGYANGVLSPRLLKFMFGQHILSGFSVAAGVGAVAVVASACFGFTAGMVAGSGAICVSIGDQPNPLPLKAATLPIAWGLAVCASFPAALAIDMPWLEGLTVVFFGIVAGMLLGWGRWAIPLSILTMLAIVFTLGTPIDGFNEALRYEALFAGGGLAYVFVALAVTHLVDASGRRLAVGECLREFAAYLRVVANLYETEIDRASVYVRVIEQQAALSDHLQTARSLVFSGRRRDVTLSLAAALVVLLDTLDALVSANADRAPARLVEASSPLAQRIAGLARLMAGDLERLALDLLTGQHHLHLPDRQEALEGIAAEASRLASQPAADRRLIRAGRMTRSRFNWATRHLQRLPAVLDRRAAAEEILEDVDLDAFVPPQSRSLSILRGHMHHSSPVFRHAIRLGLSLGTGYALIALIPALSHGNWILLTIAVILRASYSVTRQRRNDRMAGTLIGCVIAGMLLWVAPPTVLLGIMLVAVGTAHAFGRVHYRITSIAACVMALLSLHLLDPVEAPPVLARLFDTVIGISIAYLFSRILPRWEHQDAQQLVTGLLRGTTIYADRCLRWNIAQQSYRLARKTLIESLAALSESAARMKGEPEHVRALWPEYGRLLAASYATAAQIVTVRLIIRNRGKDLDPRTSESLLDATRRDVLSLLDPSLPLPEYLATAPEPTIEAGTEADEVLALRCAEVRHAAWTLRQIASQPWTVSSPKDARQL